MKLTSIITVLLVFVSCSGKQTAGKTAVSEPVAVENTSTEQAQHSVARKNGYNKIIGEIEYTFQFFTALEYLRKTGQQPEQEDLELLRKETVLVVTFTGKASSDLYEKSVMSESDLQLYLTGNITGDIALEQPGSEIEIPGCQILDNGARKDRLGVLFFIKGLNTGKEFTGIFYDQLFNGGLIRIPSTKLSSK